MYEAIKKMKAKNDLKTTADIDPHTPTKDEHLLRYSHQRYGEHCLLCQGGRFNR